MSGVVVIRAGDAVWEYAGFNANRIIAVRRKGIRSRDIASGVCTVQAAIYDLKAKNGRTERLK